MLDAAFEALKTYDWGADRGLLDPIDEAIVASHGEASARRELEARLVAVLTEDVSRDAKDFVCRKLMIVGTADCVANLSELLADPAHSHMARYALERIPATEAAEALRAALAPLPPALKIGVIGSLGVRQEDASVVPLAELLDDADSSVARSAAAALGAIRTSAAAKALSSAKPRTDVMSAVTDASLSCAEGLLRAGDKSGALAVYKSFAGGEQPKHVRLAATRGMLACAGQ
jgi:HEAT repeat protein